MPKKATTIGGQALIEGIMMKGPKKTAIAVRLPDKTIDVSYMEEKHLRDKCKFFGLPVIRGAVAFGESLYYGYKALMFSAEKSGFTDIDEPDEKKDEEQKKKENAGLMAVIGVLSTILAVVLVVGLFVYLPTFLFNLLNNALGGAVSALRSVFEGIVKIILFVSYVAIVSLQSDIKRVFSYHGAEHKTIFCYESGEELTVENVKGKKRFHPRCGTSFMILVLIVNIVIFGIIAKLFPQLTAITALWIAIRIILLPIVCGLGYELIKFCGRHDNIVTKIISAPGMWLQRLTTKEPDDDMIEIAIASLTAVIPENPDEDRW